MKDLKYNLGVLAIFDMLKLDSDNCLKMYKNLTFLSPEMLSDLLAATILVMYNSSLLTKLSLKNIKLLFDQMYIDYPEKTVYFNKNTYGSRKYLKRVKIDEDFKLLFDDIKKRYFGINNFLDELLKKKAVSDYYLENYEQIVSDIPFDLVVFKYLLGEKVNEKDLIDIRFLYSISYLYLSKPEMFDNELIKNKIINIVSKINNDINDNKQIDKILKRVVKYGFKL